ncbi:hypothetical protein BDW66DRAFT_141774 [Aspergillus desertorum]
MAKKGGKGKKGKRSGSAAAAAANNKAAEPVAAAASEFSVEANVAKSESESEQNLTVTAEALTSTTATAAPETIPDTLVSAPAVPPIVAAAAENKDEVPVPAAEGAPIEEAVEAIPKIETKEDELKETAVTTETKTETVIAPLTTPEVIATTTLPERPKELEIHEESNAKRPLEVPIFTEKEHKPAKIPRVEDESVAEPTTAETSTGREFVDTAADLPSESSNTPQMVPGLGAHPADKPLADLEAPGFSVESSEEAASVVETPEKPQDAVIIGLFEAPTAQKETIPSDAKAPEPELTKAEDAPTETKPSPTTSALNAVGPTTKTGNEEAKTLPKTQDPAVTQPTAAAATVSTGAPEALAVEAPVAEEKPKETTSVQKVPSVVDKAPADATTGPAATVGTTAEGESKTAPPAQQEPAVSKPTAAAATATATATPAADNKQKAEEASKSKLETSGVTKPSAVVTPPEKAHAAPNISEATGATPSTADKPNAANTQTQPERPSRLSESAAAARAATQKSQQAKAAESQPAGKEQSDAAAVATKPEDGKTSEQQTPAAQQETAKADKRKSGFFGWLKRKVKGT